MPRQNPLNGQQLQAGVHMAKEKNNDSNGKASRVYSASSVHKRRAPAPASKLSGKTGAQKAIKLPERFTKASRQDGQYVAQREAWTLEQAEMQGSQSAASVRDGQLQQETRAAAPISAAEIRASLVEEEAAAEQNAAGQNAAEGTAPAAAVTPRADATRPAQSHETAVQSGESPEAEDWAEDDWASAAAPRAWDTNAPVQQMQVGNRDARGNVRRRAVAGGYRPAGNLRRHSVVGRAIAVVLTVVLIAVIAVGGYFSWDRWLRYDDAADFQGEWYVYGTDAMVTVDNSVIRMREDISYKYTLDTMAKTIEYKFGTMRGSGRYYFDNDHQLLVIVDGQGFTSLTTLWEDLKHFVSTIVPSDKDKAAQELSKDNTIVFSRTIVHVKQYEDELAAAGAQREAQAAFEAAQTGGSKSDAASVEAVPPTLSEAITDLAISDIMMSSATASEEEGASEGDSEDESEDESDWEGEDE